ncbi:MAG: type II secretion system F family protein [Thermoleophilia bacterium]|nr:type II secretion system F family protein [Thermoleophilia bacterium]
MVGLAILLGLVGVVTIVVASVGPRTGGVSGLPVLPRPIEQWLAQLLERAAMAGPPILIVLIAVGGGVAVAVTLLLVRGSFVLGAVGSVVPGIVIGTRITLRVRRYPDRVADALPGAMRAISDGLAAGRSLRDALVRASRETPPPLSVELEAVVDELAYGGRLTAALERLATRVPRAPVQMFVAAVLVCASSGGNLARVLAELAEQLDNRARVTRELRGLGAQARLTAWLVAGLPAFGALALEALAPGVLGRTLLHGIGLLGLAAASMLMVVAGLLVRSIGRIGC